MKKRLFALILGLSSSSPVLAQDMLFQSGHMGATYLALGVILVAIGLIFLAKKRYNEKPLKLAGFVSIIPGKPQRFYAIDPETISMEPVVQALADHDINVYSNLGKITLAHKPGGVYLEEKNYKISILVNRRRCRRCYLNDGDILDMGELTLMFQTPMEPTKVQETQGAPLPKQGIPRVKKNTGKLLKSYPTLVPADSRKKTYHLTKNITYIGRSEMNDLTPRSKALELRHSKIERISGRYKITDLNSQAGTFVNGRRVETKFLKDGDVISFESVKYSFSMNGKTR